MMTSKEFYTRQIEYYTRSIEWTNRDIKWETENIKREREEVRKLADFVWSKGVLTRTEMEIWGNDSYKTPEMKKSEARRNRLYRCRAKEKRMLKKYEELLANA